MRWLLTILLSLLSLCAAAQHNPFNDDSFWQRIRVDSSIIYQPGDTVIVIASNRQVHPHKLRFMAEKRSRHHLHYFIGCARKGIWLLQPTGSLQQAVASIPAINKDWIVYTEGMGKIFTSDLDRGFRMAGSYNTHVLLLDYPSIRSNYHLIQNYFFAIHNARIAYRSFVPVLDTFKQLAVRKSIGTGHITLFFHSMGNNVVWKMVQHNKLHLMNDGLWVDNLVLNAACVPQNHHKHWVDKIHFAHRIYINYNPNDHTLKGAHLVSFRKQLGEMVLPPVSSNATYINFSKVAGHEHSNFLTLPMHRSTMPAAIDYYKVILHGLSADVNNARLFAPSDYKHIGWDLLPATKN